MWSVFTTRVAGQRICPISCPAVLLNIGNLVPQVHQASISSFVGRIEMTLSLLRLFYQEKRREWLSLLPKGCGGRASAVESTGNRPDGLRAPGWWWVWPLMELCTGCRGVVAPFTGNNACSNSNTRQPSPTSLSFVCYPRAHNAHAHQTSSPFTGKCLMIYHMIDEQIDKNNLCFKKEFLHTPSCIHPILGNRT